MLHKDRVALITAGAGGFGSATALMMAREGARVVIADIDQASSEALLENLAGGEPRDSFTEEARASLERLSRSH